MEKGERKCLMWNKKLSPPKRAGTPAKYDAFHRPTELDVRCKNTKLFKNTSFK